MPGEADHRAAHLGPRHKTVGGHIGRNVWICKILDGQRQSAVILGARSGFHSLRHLFLHHHRDTAHRHMAFKQSHDNGSRDIIRQICHYLHRSSAIMLPNQCLQVHFQDILVDNRHIRVIRQRVLKNGDQHPVDFHRHHFSGRLRQVLRQSTYPRPDLHHTVFFRDPGRGDDLVQHMRINQKVLPELLLKRKFILFNNFYCLLRVG